MFRETGRRQVMFGAIAIALVVGLTVPALTGIAGSAAILALVPGILLLWNPEIAIVLLQDVLGIIQAFTDGLGFGAESGFAIAMLVIAVVGYLLLGFRYRLNFRALLSPLAILNYAMVAMLAIALLRSGGVPYGQEKLLGFIAFNMVGFALASLAPAERRRRLLYAYLVVAGLGLINLVMTALTGGLTGRLEAFGANPIWTARMMVAAGLITLWLPEVSYRLKIPVAGMFLTGAVLTGSRGPMLGFALAVLLAILGRAVLAREHGRVGTWLALLAAVSLAIGFGYLGLRAIATRQAETNPESPIARVFADTSAAQGSSSTRLTLYEISFGEFKESPFFGVGLGGLEQSLITEGEIYSHNLLLEVAAETGVVGLLIHVISMLLAVLLAIRYLRAPDKRIREDIAIGLIMLVFAYANAQVSGDLVGNKMTWFFLGYLNGAIRTWHPAGRRTVVASSSGRLRVRSSLDAEKQVEQ